MKYTMTENICKEGLTLLEGEKIFIAHDANPLNYLEEMKDTDALILRAAPSKAVNSEVIQASAQLKVIGRTGVGVDSVDVEAATKAGIPVVITPGANNRAVAEHVLAMMLALSKNLVEGHIEVTKGNWKIRDAHKAFELSGKKAGIIGLGRIGRDTAALCKAMGMTIAVYDPFLAKNQIDEMGFEYYENYEDLLRNADVVTIHVPLTPETEKMIDAPQLSMMKETALLINCSRGEIVNEEALIEALSQHKIAGAGLDVFIGEELHPGNPLIGTKNLIYSPHSAAQTREAVINMATMCVEGCKAVCAGKKWRKVADLNVYAHPRWEGKEWAD